MVRSLLSLSLSLSRPSSAAAGTLGAAGGAPLAPSKCFNVPSRGEIDASKQHLGAIFRIPLCVVGAPPARHSFCMIHLIKQFWTKLKDVSLSPSFFVSWVAIVVSFSSFSVYEALVKTIWNLHVYKNILIIFLSIYSEFEGNFNDLTPHHQFFMYLVSNAM